MSPIRPTWVHATILGTFCAGFGVALALTDDVTKNPIKERALEDKMASLGQVIPTSIHDNNPVLDAITLTGAEGKPTTVYRAMKGGAVTGVAYEVDASGGYGGPIKLMLGVDPQGKLLGVSVPPGPPWWGGPNQPKVSSSSPCWPCFVHLAAARATAGSRGRCAADTSCVQASAALNHAAPATPALQARNEGHERPRCVGARGDAAASNCGARGGGPQATFALDALKLKKFNPQIKTVIIKI